MEKIAYLHCKVALAWINEYQDKYQLERAIVLYTGINVEQPFLLAKSRSLWLAIYYRRPRLPTRAGSSAAPGERAKYELAFLNFFAYLSRIFNNVKFLNIVSRTRVMTMMISVHSFWLAILCPGDILHDEIIDWRYIAWRDYSLAIYCLEIYCWRYFANDILLAIFLPWTGR